MASEQGQGAEGLFGCMGMGMDMEVAEAHADHGIREEESETNDVLGWERESERERR